jgi:hypothetical protein
MQRDRESSWRDSVTSVSETNRNPPPLQDIGSKIQNMKLRKIPDDRKKLLFVLHQHGLTSSSAPFL